jgi:hypothetical protein
VAIIKSGPAGRCSGLYFLVVLCMYCEGRLDQGVFLSWETGLIFIYLFMFAASAQKGERASGVNGPVLFRIGVVC